MLLSENQEYSVFHGDCIPHMVEEMEPHSVDFSVYSPPFPSLFSYTSEACDLGNCSDLKWEAKIHLSFFYRALARVLKPGRIAVVHVTQIPGLARNGVIGTFDFRGLNIRLAQRAGLIYQYDWLVSKNPQALKNGTKVITPDGPRNIEELAVGDMVIGSNGMPTRVKGVYPHEKRTMYKVSFSDNTEIECDGKHLWEVATVNGPNRIHTTEEIIRIGPLTGKAATPRFKIPIISSPAKFSCGDPLPIDPYTLGVLLGDGCFVSRSSVSLTTEKGVVDLTSLPEGHSWNKLEGKDRDNGNVSTYLSNGDRWHNNIVVSAIRDLGLFGCRAWEKKIPVQYLLASPWDRLEILRGLMDTDGTIKTKSGIVCKFITTSKQLAQDVVFIAQSLGGVARIKDEQGSRYFHKGEERFGRLIYGVNLRMPEGCCPFKLERKASRWKPTKKTICRWIQSIVPTQDSECTCIEVEAADSLYVAENFIVTHNSQAIRTHSHKLLFVTLERDRQYTCGAMGDYLIKFIAPGENKVPIDSEEITRNEWIDWAEACWPWRQVRETDTLNTKRAKSEEDTKHICPLQLPVINRLVRLYSNPGEIVFSPFAGIGSEGYESLLLGRRFYGCEIKPEYYQECLRNLEIASKKRKDKEKDLFSSLPA